MERNTATQGFSVISGRNSGGIEGDLHHYLKKQSQFAACQMTVKSFILGDYDYFLALRLRKNKGKQSQTPAFGRKLEARNPKSETRAFDRERFEKTKPISKTANERKRSNSKVLQRKWAFGAKKTKPILSTLKGVEQKSDAGCLSSIRSRGLWDKNRMRHIFVSRMKRKIEPFSQFVRLVL
jgi:hypothetical protein